jgi:ATP-dependent Zn protease
VIGNHSIFEEKALGNALHSSGTTFTNAFPNEAHIGYMALFGIYSYGCVKLLSYLKDMHGFKGKEKRDIQSKQSVKTLEDVGGCQDAKKAILEVIDYIQNPEQFQ